MPKLPKLKSYTAIIIQEIDAYSPESACQKAIEAVIRKYEKDENIQVIVQENKGATS